MNRPEINVTPLIDVLLVLLIIFMVITPVKPSVFESRIPSEKPADPSVREHPDTIVIGYAADSQIRLNRESVDATISNTDALTEKLKILFAKREGVLNKERTVFIRAPKSVDYGSVVKLIDAVKAAGAEPISLQIDDLDT